MSLGYTWEVFYTATRILASGTGRIQERLENTFGSYLAPRLLGPNLHLPAEQQKKAKDLIYRASCKEARADEGTVAATCRVMDDLEAKKLAEDLVDFYDQVAQLYGAEKCLQDLERKKKK